MNDMGHNGAVSVNRPASLDQTTDFVPDSLEFR